MKEMKITTSNLGVMNMKKSLLIVALAMVLVFAFATTALAKNAGSPAVSPGNGYLTWAQASSLGSLDAMQDNGPHADYTTTTIKCVVCHSVHGAPKGTFLLTKALASDVTSASTSVVCSYCHGVGATASTKIVSLTIGSSTSPHSGRCAAEPGCHAPSPHGVGASTYPVLSSRLLNDGADTVIALAISESATTGVDADTFSTLPSGQTDYARSQITMATGYLCSSTGCHNESAFAIGARGDAMYVQAGGHSTAEWQSGHPVLATATTTWTNGIAGAAAKQVAWADANGCEDCHDLTDASRGGATAFPHNTLGSRLWMTKASNASRSDATTITGDLALGVTAVDGACIKCHVSTGDTSGVGRTF